MLLFYLYILMLFFISSLAPTENLYTNIQKNTETFPFAKHGWTYMIYQSKLIFIDDGICFKDKTKNLIFIVDFTFCYPYYQFGDIMQRIKYDVDTNTWKEGNSYPITHEIQNLMINIIENGPNGQNPDECCEVTFALFENIKKIIK